MLDLGEFRDLLREHVKKNSHSGITGIKHTEPDTPGIRGRRHGLQFNYSHSIDYEHLADVARRLRFRIRREDRPHGPTITLTEGTRHGTKPIRIVLDHYPMAARKEDQFHTFFSVEHTEPRVRRATARKVIRVFELLSKPRREW